VRSGLLSVDGLYDEFDAAGIVDVGDVFVNPHIVDDSYHNASTLHAIRAARGRSDSLAVAPNSALRAVLEACRELNPSVRFIIIGGDHSLSRVPVEFLTADDRNGRRDLGIFHVDAHTDLLDQRDGIPFNFATWAYHANDAIGRGRRLVQLGIRVSGRSREAWESELDLRQIRMDEVGGRDHDDVTDEIIETLENAGVRRLYISNDIDGTDPTFAASTGTMEMGGLHPHLVSHVVGRLGRAFDVIGSDVVEVAPPLKWHVPGEPARTIRTACRYVLDQLDAMLGTALRGPFDSVEPADADVVARFPGFV
jgi:agmatinase